ncbi:Uncharacterised protein [Mycobacterium tuberculosis]|nr:Uncharacterised protein [Mycobacterium tuberculosis]
MRSGSGPRFAGTGWPGLRRLAVAKWIRWERLARLTTVARAGSAAMDGWAARVARSSSSSHSGVGCRATFAAWRMSSRPRGVGLGNTTR